MPSVKKMLELIPVPRNNQGGKSCNAIDEDVYDSSDWSDNMPSDGFVFYQGENDVSVSYDSYFACYDGWDMMSEDHGEFPHMHAAVKHIYDMILSDYRIMKIRKKLKKFNDITLDKIVSDTVTEDEVTVYFGMLKLVKLELRYTK